MKNWQRLKNHYGKRDMWIYEIDEGSRYIECDEDGWIDINALIPDTPKHEPSDEYLVTDESGIVTAAYRWADGTWDDGEGLQTFEPIGWQPMPRPMKPKS